MAAKVPRGNHETQDRLAAIVAELRTTTQRVSEQSSGLSSGLSRSGREQVPESSSDEECTCGPEDPEAYRRRDEFYHNLYNQPRTKRIVQKEKRPERAVRRPVLPECRLRFANG